MRFLGLVFAALFVPLATAAPAPCSSGARTFLPCELTFDRQASDPSSYESDVLRVEFRSPTHKTYLMHSFSDGGPLRIRFSPTEPGVWAYHVLSEIARYNDKEDTFTAADSGLSGMVNVANLRHWRTSDKKPHLWISAAVPFLALPQAQFESWLDARKRDGFTHVRGPLLAAPGTLKIFDDKGQPDSAYFSALDDRLLAAATRGFTLDLLFADQSFLKSGALPDVAQREKLVRFLCARYAGLNVAWQGIETFEQVPHGRALLKDLFTLIQKYDGFDHPRSTDARDSSFPVAGDGWLTYLIEASGDAQLGAVEHQFTMQPEIHVIRSGAPDAFRHELWSCTTNGEYPSVSYESLQNEANLKAVQTWVRILSGTRHWEFEPYFDVDGARAAGLNEVEYLAYAQTPGIVEITLPKHKYNPLWIDPATGQELAMKDYKGEVFSRSTPDNSHDWILQVPRAGKKENMLKYFYFESEDPPVQEVETDSARVPFVILDPAGDQISTQVGVPFSVKVTRANRASRHMQYVWWGEVADSGEGMRLLAVGSKGNLLVPPELASDPGASLHLRLLAINANGKAYELNHVFRLTP
jgi:hypothetical protein